MNLILNALNYYDTNKEIIKPLMEQFKLYKIIENTKDLQHSTIEFFDYDKNKIAEYDFEIVGQFINLNKLWIWAWAIPNLEKNKIYLSKKILYYGLDLVPDSKSLFLKTELITSRFQISDFLQLDIHSSIASYISKIKFIFPIIYRSGKDNKEQEYKICDTFVQKKIMEKFNDFEITFLFLLEK